MPRTRTPGQAGTTRHGRPGRSRRASNPPAAPSRVALAAPARAPRPASPRRRPTSRTARSRSCESGIQTRRLEGARSPCAEERVDASQVDRPGPIDAVEVSLGEPPGEAPIVDAGQTMTWVHQETLHAGVVDLSHDVVIEHGLVASIDDLIGQHAAEQPSDERLGAQVRALELGGKAA